MHHMQALHVLQEGGGGGGIASVSDPGSLAGKYELASESEEQKCMRYVRCWRSNQQVL
jgi:hypothetical protein